MLLRTRFDKTYWLSTLAILVAMASPRAAHANDAFSVMSLNLWYGGTKAGAVSATSAAACSTTGIGTPIGLNASLVETRDLLKARMTADQTTLAVVGLQEVYRGVQYAANPEGVSDGSLNEDKQLATLLSTPASTWFSAFGETRGAAAGTRGNALVTNVGNEGGTKVESWNFGWDDAKHCDVNPDGSAVDNEQCDYGEHARGGVATRIQFPSNPSGHIAWVVSVHLDGLFNGDVAARQVFEVLGNIKRFDPDFPVIVVGDFNVKNSQGDSYDRTTAAMAAADFIPVVAHQRVHMYLYDPHMRLRVTRASAPCPTDVRNGQTIMLSDHQLLDAVFDWVNP